MNPEVSPERKTAFMFWIFAEAIPTLDATALGVGLGALAIGLVPMVWYWVKRVPYYRTPPLEVFTADHPLPTPRPEAVVVPDLPADAPAVEAVEPA